MRLLTFDPGGTTGIARYDSAENQRYFVSFELPTFAALDAIYELLSSESPPDLVVGERFIIGQGTVKKTRAGSYAALHSFGAVEYLCHRFNVDFDSQTPSERKFADNAKLKLLGWRNPTPGGHCDDAARHMLVACVKRGLVDPAIFLEEQNEA